MLKDLRALGRETLVYGLSTVVARLLNFLLVPLYTHWLAPAEYGTVALLFSYIALLNILFQYGMDQAYLRFAAQRPREEADVWFSCAGWALIGTSLAFGGALHAGASALAPRLGLGTDGVALIRYSAWILAFDAMAALPFAELRLRHRAWAFAGVRMGHIAANLALNVWLVGGLGLGARGVFLASLAAAAWSLALLVGVYARRLRPVLEGARLKELLAFGLPLVPAGLGAMMVQVIDRPILKLLSGDAAVGIYQANARLAVFMTLIVNMFDQAWRPFYLERAGQKGAPELFGRVLTYFLAVSAWVVLALSLFIGDIARLPLPGGETLIQERYWAGLGVVPVVLLANLLHGVYIHVMASVVIAKRTGLVAWTTGLGAAVTVAANFLLIPSLGLMGAAWAALAAHAAMTAGLYLAGRKLYPIPYERGRLLRVAAAASLCAAAAWALRLGGAAGGGWIAARLGALALFPALLLAPGFLRDGERRVLRSFLALSGRRT